MSVVRFFSENILGKLKSEITSFGKTLKKGSRIAIKLHMGEHGNLFYLRPIYAATIVDALKQHKPFLFDSPVVYSGGRHTPELYMETAKRNGYSRETIGADIIISNRGVKLSTELGDFDACYEVLNCDALIVLSHFKGHPLTNFGGAIKNIGMGCFTSQSKGKLHDICRAYIANRDACIGCGACIAVCPFAYLRLKDDNKIKMSDCGGCCACVSVCPTHALEMKTVPLSKGLAVVTASFLRECKAKSILYVNVLMDIAAKCDCWNYGFHNEQLELAAPNLGIMVSNNIVAIDKASLDLVNSKTDGRFSRIWKANEMWQLEKAADLGLGKLDYDLRIV